ncbi:MAG: DUF4271 domain-containing protein [Lutibacter sp.]|uniref:DUF4271 domain-containing protein n=1 Tax=Lutibacter sp. TaxID=1925666 RepID=UPI0019FFD3DE|nr:DUF4271 domain-containing protein [Lutibacter sp.]
MFEATKIIQGNNDWITLVLLAVFSILTLLKILYKNRLIHINTLFISNRNITIYFNKEKNRLLDGFHMLFFIIQLLILSLLFYLGNVYFQFQKTELNFNYFLLIFCGIGGYLISHYLVGLLIAFLFDFKKEYSKIIFFKLNYFNNLVLWLFPFLILSFYAASFNYLLLKITLVLLVLLINLITILILVNNKKLILSNLFYFILYICALEIAPLIIILKLTI